MCVANRISGLGAANWDSFNGRRDGLFGACHSTETPPAQLQSHAAGRKSYTVTARYVLQWSVVYLRMSIGTAVCLVD